VGEGGDLVWLQDTFIGGYDLRDADKL